VVASLGDQKFRATVPVASPLLPAIRTLQVAWSDFDWQTERLFAIRLGKNGIPLCLPTTTTGLNECGHASATASNSGKA
jgi:hypothetical protein